MTIFVIWDGSKSGLNKNNGLNGIRFTKILKKSGLNKFIQFSAPVDHHRLRLHFQTIACF